MLLRLPPSNIHLTEKEAHSALQAVILQRLGLAATAAAAAPPPQHAGEALSSLDMDTSVALRRRVEWAQTEELKEGEDDKMTTGRGQPTSVYASPSSENAQARPMTQEKRDRTGDADADADADAARSQTPGLENDTDQDELDDALSSREINSQESQETVIQVPISTGVSTQDEEDLSIQPSPSGDGVSLHVLSPETTDLAITGTGTGTGSGSSMRSPSSAMQDIATAASPTATSTPSIDLPMSASASASKVKEGGRRRDEVRDDREVSRRGLFGAQWAKLSEIKRRLTQ